MKITDIFHAPYVTEKAINLVEEENSLVFITSQKATKKMVKKAIEMLYKLKVKSVNSLIMPNGRKKVIIKFAKENAAADLASKLGYI
jgi:ribosomal protein L23